MTKVRVFDTVIVEEWGNERRFTREAFLALPLRDRVRWILNDRARFFLGETPVDAKVAMRSISSPTMPAAWPWQTPGAAGDREPE